MLAVRLVVLMGALGLSGCVGTGQPPLSPEELRAIDRDKCASFGFKPRSKDFADCMMRLSLRREADEAAERRAWIQSNAIDQRPIIAEHHVHVAPYGCRYWFDDGW
ncbi:hypothetical protein ACFQU1_05925 [Chelatococcus sp. GCM10030263]|uniref:hypothetical protein n=1 Tax=Chelatococcus sp. GCM10030263 TaxID=3273387 RepID=UPI00360C7C09